MNLFTEALCNRAEEYQRRGESLPADLYATLMANGIDASLYQDFQHLDEDEDNQKEIHNVD